MVENMGHVSKGLFRNVQSLGLDRIDGDYLGWLKDAIKRRSVERINLITFLI
jgi:hypothetical protein